MFRLKVRVAVSILVILFGGLGVAKAAPSREKIFKDALKFTVFIEQVTTTPFNGRSAGYTNGSGFVIDKAKGLIVTNAHVASEGIGKIKVRFENRDEFDAEVVYVDSKYDMAVIRIDPKQGRTQIGEAKLGDSDRIEAGRAVGTFGNPSSFSFSATSGVISANDRTDPNMQFAGEYFQTDAAISRGNSGGPLIDLETGEVIGINTWVWLDERGNQVPGLGFSLKLNIIRETLDRIRLGKEKPVVGWVGLTVQEVSRQRAEENYGLGTVKLVASEDHAKQYLVVTATTAGSPAAAAGFKRLDLLLSADDGGSLDSLASAETLLNLHVGKNLGFNVLRREGAGFTRKLVKVSVANRNDDNVKKYLTVSGMAVHHLTIRFREEFSIPQEGVLVSFVQEGSKADLSGIQMLDIIHAVNGQTVNSVDDLWKVLSKLPPTKRKVEVYLRRYRQYRPDKVLELEVDLPELFTVKN